MGVLGTASIAVKNIAAMASAEGVACVKVGSRDPERARAYAAQRGVAGAGTYEEVLADPTIAAVYVPLPTALHDRWVQAAARAGKHVLCEKPAATDARQLDAILSTCLQQNIAFMDGVMFMHHPRLHLLLQRLRQGALGSSGARHLSSAFSFPGDEGFFKNNIRVKSDGDPLGCLGDLGWYNVRMALMVFGEQPPATVTATAHQSTAEGVPLAFTGNMVWAPDAHTLGGAAARTSSFFCSFQHAVQQWVRVSGSAATMMMDDFVVPKRPDSAQMVEASQDFVHDGKRVHEATSVHVLPTVRPQEVLMMEAFARLASTGDAAARARWMRLAMNTQLTIDALLSSARNGGVRTPVDVYHLAARYESAGAAKL